MHGWQRRTDESVDVGRPGVVLVDRVGEISEIFVDAPDVTGTNGEDI
jgi:hypothetical protein